MMTTKSPTQALRLETNDEKKVIESNTENREMSLFAKFTVLIGLSILYERPMVIDYLNLKLRQIMQTSV